MASTLLLDLATWDLTKDANGNIAMAAEPYALAQDAASALRLFRGELWYDTTQGVPYFESILDKLPPIEFLKAQFVAAAESVSGVAGATCVITGFVDRQLSGQVQIISQTGQTLLIGVNQPGAIPWYVTAVSP